MVGTVLITGCSSGFGKATAITFRQAGWNVVATMRNPEQWEATAAADDLVVTALDVRDGGSVAAAIAQAADRFGRIDCVVNNAGAGLFSVFGATPDETIQSLFDTNVFGAMRVMRAVLPHFAAHGGGRIVNVTSSAAISPDPLMSVYGASKAALDAFSEAVQWELRTQHVVVKLVEPGFVVGTQFVQQTQAAAYAVPVPPGYQAYVDQRMAAYSTTPPVALATAQDVADAVLAAATDTTDRLRFVVGADAALMARMRFETSEDEYRAWTSSRFAAQ